MKTRPCHLCGSDCTGGEYLKDRKSRYFHKTCLAEAKQRKAEEQAAAEELQLSPLLEEALSQEVDTGKPCPSCGGRAKAESVLCTACGYNFQTGAAAATSFVAAKESKVGGAAKAVASWQASMLQALVGASVAGVAGAFLWAAIAFYVGFEIVWIGVGIGFMCGFGALLGARHQAGVISGAIAALVTVASIFGGRFITAQWVADEINQAVQLAIGSSSEPIYYAMPLLEDGTWMEADQAVFHDLNIRTFKLERRGETVDWPAGSSWEVATGIKDFPPAMIQVVRDEHNAMTIDDRNNHFRSLARDVSLAEMARQRSMFDNATGDRFEAPANRQGPEEHWLVTDYRGQLRSDVTANWNIMGDVERVAWYNENVAYEWEELSGADLMSGEFQDGSYRSMRSFLFLGIAMLIGMGAAYKAGSNGDG